MITNNVAKVRKGSRNEKLLTVPADSDIEVGDLVRIVKVRIEDEE